MACVSGFCPQIIEDGEELIVVGYPLEPGQLAEIADMIGEGEIALRIPREVFLEAARRALGVE